MNSQGSPSRRRVWILASVFVVVVTLGAAVAMKVGYEVTRPVAIQPLSSIPPEWNLPAGKKIEDLSEYFLEYKLTGKLPGNANDQYYLVVHGPDPTPYMRILYGDELQKGGRIGLAVQKRKVKYTVSLRGYGPQGNGPRYSNVLTFTY